MSDETAAPAASATTTPGTTAEDVNFTPPTGGYPDHPLAAIFPMLPPEEVAEMAESIRTSGQREPAVLYEGLVLDGRNRQAACGIAGVECQYTTFDPAKDGSPAQFVLDKNMRRRQLTVSQKLAAAAELMPLLQAEAEKRRESSQFQPGNTAAAGAGDEGYTPDDDHERQAAAAAEGGAGGNVATTVPDSHVDTTGDFAQTPPKKTAAAKATPAKAAAKSRDVAAAAMGVSPRAVQDATKLMKEDPKKFADVKAGKTTINAALKATPTAGTKAAAEYDEALVRIGKVCGPAQVTAIKEGAILRNKKDVVAYAKLTDEQMRNIKGLLDIGYSVSKAIHHKSETLLPTHQLMDAITRAAQNGGTYTQVVVAEETGADWEISIKRVAKKPGAAPAKAASAPATTAKAPAKPAAAKPAAKAASKAAAKPAKAKGKPGPKKK